jgi:hypothetical protein
MPPLPPFAQQQQQIRHKQILNTSEWNGGIIEGSGSQQQPHSPPQYSADSGIAVGGGGGGGSSNFSQQQQRHLIHQQSSESGHVFFKYICVGGKFGICRQISNLPKRRANLE